MNLKIDKILLIIRRIFPKFSLFLYNTGDFSYSVVYGSMITHFPSLCFSMASLNQIL